MDPCDDLEEDKHLSHDLKSLQMVLTQSERFSFYDTHFDDTVPEPIKTREHIIQLLQLNKEYQEILQICVKQIEAAKLRNDELQKKVKSFMQSNKARRAPSKKGNLSYFSDASNDLPMLNLDAKKKIEREGKMPLHFKFKKWNKTERTTLAQGVERQNKRTLYNQLLEEYRKNNDGKHSQDIAKIVSDQVNSISPDEFRKEIKGIDWDAVSKFVTTRGAIDCKLQWLNNDHPFINEGSWSKEEDKKLLELVKKYKCHEWEQIAQELGTRRIAFQCFRRYQRSLNTAMVKGKWTAQEDNELKEAIKRFGVKNWQQVANCLIGRTGQQCLHRWQKTLKPNIKRGRWTPDEDKALTLAVKAYGSKSWIKVQQHVQGRTDVQCRERWVNILNPNLNVGAWTTEEDKKLDEAVQIYGMGKWSQIAQLLAPRTDNQCWRRWKALHHDELDEYRNTILKKRIGMVSNFVGREKERPSLTPDDFDIENQPPIVVKEVEEKEQDPLIISNSIEETFILPPMIDPLPLSFSQKDYPEEYDPNDLPESLPLLLDQPASLAALQKLCATFAEIQLEDKESEPLTEEEESKLVASPEFALLGGVFNSIFLCPMLLYSQKYYSEVEDVSIDLL